MLVVGMSTLVENNVAQIRHRFSKPKNSISILLKVEKGDVQFSNNCTLYRSPWRDQRVYRRAGHISADSQRPEGG